MRFRYKLEPCISEHMEGIRVCYVTLRYVNTYVTVLIK